VEERRIAIRKGKWTYFVLDFDLITCESLPSLSSFVIDSIRRNRRLTWFFSHAHQPHCFASLCFFSLFSYNLHRMSVSEPESSIHSLFSEVEDEHLLKTNTYRTRAGERATRIRNFEVDLGEARLVGQ